MIKAFLGKNYGLKSWIVMHAFTQAIIRALENIVAVVTKPLYGFCKLYFSDMFSFSKLWTFVIYGNATLVLYPVIVRLHLYAKKVSKSQVK